MQAKYVNKIQTPNWDTLNVNYTVRKFPDTGISSETIAHQWINQPETLKANKQPIDELKDYIRGYNITRELTRSQTSLDFEFKLPLTHRFNKHTSCSENQYIYPPARRLADSPPQCPAHGTTEMRSAYTAPTYPSSVVTEKNQYKHPATIIQSKPETTRPLKILPAGMMYNHEHRRECAGLRLEKDFDCFDTTHEGFEKYLDPYLTTSRLHHRPYTADQLSRPSATNDIVTYYTYADIPWTRTQKPKIGEWFLPIKKHKTVFDREKFKEDFREVRAHNKLNWIPGAFRTETRDNYVSQSSRPESKIQDYEPDIRTCYKHSLLDLLKSHSPEPSTFQQTCVTENSHVGSGKPLCSVLDQYVEKNARLDNKCNK